MVRTAAFLVGFGTMYEVAGKTLLVNMKSLDLSTPIYADLNEHSAQAVRTYLGDRYGQVQGDFFHALNAQLETMNLKLPRYHPLWIQNTIIMYDVDEHIENVLKSSQYVASVEEDAIVQLNSHLIDNEIDNIDPDDVQKNIHYLHADEAWALGWDGLGVVVASIDSGVRYTHEALRQTYRGYRGKDKVPVHDYAFWVPASQNQTLTADNADLVGHGTHTMGVAVGGLGYGVAPNATWITARPFKEDETAAQSDILLAAQWVMCPTKVDGSHEDCSKGAQIISNSFGGDNTVHWMDAVVRAWRQANIFPIFASGNVNGFKCGTILCPGCLIESIAVGALLGHSSLWGASGKGPSTAGQVKPDFVAPGFAIRSAWSLGDDRYQGLTGTSMATPHVSGSIAILLQKCLKTQSKDHCTVDHILSKLQKTASHELKKPFLVPSKCGGTSFDTYPNNIYGYGLPNVLHGVSLSNTSSIEMVNDEVAIE